MDRFIQIHEKVKGNDNLLEISCEQHTIQVWGGENNEKIIMFLKKSCVTLPFYIREKE